MLYNSKVPSFLMLDLIAKAWQEQIPLYPEITASAANHFCEKRGMKEYHKSYSFPILIIP